MRIAARLRRRGAPRGWFVACGVTIFLWVAVVAFGQDSARWWKGNVHTHTLWSDGDQFPEAVVAWYKSHGYHFLTLSDHNIIQKDQKWVEIDKIKGGRANFEKYRREFGPAWVETRASGGTQQVRLKTLADLRARYQEPERFLLMTGEELTDRYRTLPLHINAYELLDYIPAQGGTSVVDVLQRNVDAVLAQRERTGHLMIPHINHPNFGYAITAEELMQIRGERFFEVYNGHPLVHNEGDQYHVGTERMWDIMLAFRLSQLNLGPLYALAVDDAHNYHVMSSTNSNPGRGWIMVRAPVLRAYALLTAMEAGDFYASSGVELRDIRRTGEELAVSIRPVSGVTYRTQFIATRRGFSADSRPNPRPPGTLFPVTRLYSPEIGAVLKEVEGTEAAYRFVGNELYVRARVISSKPKANPYTARELEMAWVQPVVLDKAGE